MTAGQSSATDSIERRRAEVLPREAGEGEDVGYWVGYLDALAFALREIHRLAPLTCDHRDGTVQREVCEDCGTAFP